MRPAALGVCCCRLSAEEGQQQQERQPPILFNVKANTASIGATQARRNQLNQPLYQHRHELEQIDSSLDQEEYRQHIRICRWSKCYKETQTKVVLMITEPAWRTTMLKSLVQVGASMKSGKVPMGHMEDELGQWLEILDET